MFKVIGKIINTIVSLLFICGVLWYFGAFSKEHIDVFKDKGQRMYQIVLENKDKQEEKLVAKKEPEGFFQKAFYACAGFTADRIKCAIDTSIRYSIFAIVLAYFLKFMSSDDGMLASLAEMYKRITGKKRKK